MQKKMPLEFHFHSTAKDEAVDKNAFYINHILIRVIKYGVFKLQF